EVITTANGVTVIGYTNVPGRLASSASQLYARNLYAFIETLFDKKTKAFAVNWDDELVKATVLTRDGAVVHPNLVEAAKPAAPTKAESAPAKPAAVAKPGAAVKPKPAKPAPVAKPTQARPTAKAPARAKPTSAAKPKAVAAEK